MKKIFTLAAALVLSVSLFAYPPQTRLTISTNSKYKVSVIIDGNTYNYTKDANNDDELIVNDLQGGYHTVKIYQQNNNRSKWGNFYNRNRQVLFEGNVYVKPQYHTDISINRFGKAFIDEKLITAGYEDEDNDNRYNNNGNRNYDNSRFAQAMDGRAFEQFKQTIDIAPSDNSKLAIAKQIIAVNYFTSAQVRDLVQLFSYENSKLDIAKYSYTYTLDKGNYFVVNDALAYAGSKEELARYLQQRR